MAAAEMVALAKASVLVDGSVIAVCETDTGRAWRRFAYAATLGRLSFGGGQVPSTTMKPKRLSCHSRQVRLGNLTYENPVFLVMIATHWIEPCVLGHGATTCLLMNPAQIPWLTYSIHRQTLTEMILAGLRVPARLSN